MSFSQSDLNLKVKKCKICLVNKEIKYLYFELLSHMRTKWEAENLSIKVFNRFFQQ